jgi:hypothetical protein
MTLPGRFARTPAFGPEFDAPGMDPLLGRSYPRIAKDHGTDQP